MPFLHSSCGGGECSLTSHQSSVNGYPRILKPVAVPGRVGASTLGAAKTTQYQFRRYVLTTYAVGAVFKKSKKLASICVVIVSSGPTSGNGASALSLSAFFLVLVCCERLHSPMLVVPSCG